MSKENINEILRKHTEETNWPYREPAKFLNVVGDLAMERFFNGLEYPDGRKVPNPITAFDDLRNRKVLAQYDLYPDEYGIIYKITHNTEHYEEQNGIMQPKFGRWGASETHVHEMIHTWQQTVGEHPYKSGRNTHNKEFVDKAKSLGLNVFPVIGFHYAPADPDSPFAKLMSDLGIQRPEDVPTIKGKPKSDWFRGNKKAPGKSTLSKWECGCGQRARVGTKEFDATCNRCGEVFVKIDGKAHNIYQA